MGKFFTLFALLLLTQFAAAQSAVTIAGKVNIASNEPLVGVSVRIKGTSEGVVTDVDGRFSLQTQRPLPVTLVLSMVGYKTEEVKVTAPVSALSVTLSEAVEELSALVVSASRTPETLDETPSSVTILPQKALQESMIVTTNLIDILSNQVPGLAPSTSTSSNWGQTLRGRPMLIMIDGVPQSTPLRNGSMDMRALDPAVIERVEVLKGATAVWGNGAAGGIINYITRTPKKDDPFSSVTELGTTGSLSSIDNSLGARISQMVYGKLDKFDYVVSGIYEQTGEWKDAEGDVLPPTYGLGETDSYNAFLKFGYNWMPGQRAQLSYNYYSSEQKTNYVSEFGNYDEKRKTAAVLGDILGVPQGVRANHNLNLRFEGEGLPGQTSYDVDAYYQSVDNVFFWSNDFVNGGQSRILSQKKGLRFAFNTPLLSSAVFASDITYGLDLLNDVTSQPLVDGRIWVPEMNMNSLAPFTQLKFSLWKDLVFKGGFRMEKVNIGVEDYATMEMVNHQTGGTTESFSVKGGSLSYNAYLFNAGVRYNKFDLFTPYASFSQGFSVADLGLMLRSARVNSIAAINTEAIIINNYEGGFVSKWKNLRLEGVGYLSTSELGTSGRFVNGVYEVMRSPEKVWGFEGIADYRILDNLSIGTSYSWTEGKLDVNDNGSVSDAEDVYLGGERISAPKLTGYVSCSLLQERLSLQLQYTGIRNRSRFEQNERGSYDPYKAPVEAYNLVNLAASYRVNESTSLRVGIENLFNEDYFPARSQWFTQPSLYTKGKGAAFNLSVNISL
ncbi:TonB-dependent receptor [Cesiribacter sp. SM1]|uniref:TonB-dependent receptor n=1 Tax=Cesiribacter sp. SM1 TaxID=2861196 RepID=UPI001CD4A84D|nr:TonB-dependent receptor [Cesiribacter sp. SM1]